MIGVAPELVAVRVTVAVTGGGGPVALVDPHAVQNIMEIVRVASSGHVDRSKCHRRSGRERCRGQLSGVELTGLS